MSANLRLLPPFELRVAGPHAESKRPWVLWIAVFLVVVAAIVTLAWKLGDERRAIENLSTDKRRQVLSRSLENLKTVCGNPTHDLRRFCGDQARFVLEFPECGTECRTLAWRQLSRMTMPR